MRLLRAKAVNFGSYSNIEFSFENQGLTLISGPTGSGKSTLMDIPFWALFGETSKGGTVDEIRSWKNNGPTQVDLEIQHNDKRYTITRIRGTAKQNDLYWYEDGIGMAHRGKDITDTQKRLNSLINMDSDTYSTAAYIHEFSPSSTFFAASAKYRREFFERLVDLTFAEKLYAACKEKIQEVKKECTAKLVQVNKLTGTVANLKDVISNSQHRRSTWQDSQNKKIKGFEDTIKEIKQNSIPEDVTDQVEKITAELKNIKKEKCPSCGNLAEGDLKNELLIVLNRLQDQQWKRERCLTTLKATEQSLQQKILEKNPYTEQTDEMARELYSQETQLDKVRREHAKLTERQNALEHLKDLTSVLRARMLEDKVLEIQNDVNRLLETYFDSEIRATFAIEDSDSLKVTLNKSGYDCSYHQLSKGQRQMLRLCFSVAVMDAASSAASNHLNVTFLDEPSDGLDAPLKERVSKLLQDLVSTRESIFVIEHDETTKNTFNNRYEVRLENDESVITHE